MTPDIRRRLVQLLGMCGSEFDGERATAALAADRLRHQLGLTWDELVAPANVAAAPPSRQGLSLRERDLADLELALDNAELFSTKQLNFLNGLAGWLGHRGPLTPKQRAALDDMLKRVEARERRAA